MKPTIVFLLLVSVLIYPLPEHVRAEASPELRGVGKEFLPGDTLAPSNVEMNLCGETREEEKAGSFCDNKGIEWKQIPLADDASCAIESVESYDLEYDWLFNHYFFSIGDATVENECVEGDKAAYSQILFVLYYEGEFKNTYSPTSYVGSGATPTSYQPERALINDSRSLCVDEGIRCNSIWDWTLFAMTPNLVPGEVPDWTDETDFPWEKVRIEYLIVPEVSSGETEIRVKMIPR